MAMSNNNIRDRIKKASNAISLVNKEAYKDVFLLSNHVLSRSPFDNNFLNRYLNRENVKGYPLYRLSFRLLSYYLKSFFHFMMYLLKFVEYYLSSFKFSPSVKNKDIIIIDTIFNIEKIEREGRFRDLFFCGLKETLEKREKHYAYLPFFYSTSYHKKPFELYRILKILKKEKVPVITEYQLLKFHDTLKILQFIITYPLHIFKLISMLKADTYEIRLLRYELLDTLDQVTFYNFSRYLTGKRAVRLPYKNFKVISWYENQPLHKNLYKGLRSDTSKVEIYGAQLFIRPMDLIYMEPDKNEEPFGVVPDCIVSNGPFYIPENSGFRYRLGPSLRSRDIFQTQVQREKQKSIVVLLPFFNDDAENILEIISDARLSSRKILLKPHPAIPLKKYRHAVPGHIIMTNEDVYKLFQEAKIVIGASSNTLLEASSLGIPVISVRNNKRFDFYNPLPEYGEGIIWEGITNSEELIRQINKFDCVLKGNHKEIDIVANRYRRMFFYEVTDENIGKAFDL